MRNVAIVAGGDSSEYGVSLRSAAGIFSFLDKQKYNITIVLLRGSTWQAVIKWEDTKDGVQVVETAPVDKNDFSYLYQGTKYSFDFAYITIHGTPGENGRLQGYFDMIGLP